MKEIIYLYLFFYIILTTIDIKKDNQENFNLVTNSKYDQSYESSLDAQDSCKNYFSNSIALTKYNNQTLTLSNCDRSKRIEFFIKKRLFLISLVTSFNESISKLDKIDQNIVLSFENKIYNNYALKSLNDFLPDSLNTTSSNDCCIRDDLSIQKKQNNNLLTDNKKMIYSKDKFNPEEYSSDEIQELTYDKTSIVEKNNHYNSDSILFDNHSLKLNKYEKIINNEDRLCNFVENFNKCKEILCANKKLYIISDILTKKPKKSSFLTKNKIKKIFKRNEYKNKITKYILKGKDNKCNKSKKLISKVNINKQKAKSLDCINSKIISSKNDTDTYENNLLYQSLDKNKNKSLMKFQKLIETKNKPNKMSLKNICRFWRRYSLKNN